MGMALTHQRTLLLAACDVPLSDPEVEGLWVGGVNRRWDAGEGVNRKFDAGGGINRKFDAGGGINRKFDAGGGVRMKCKEGQKDS